MLLTSSWRHAREKWGSFRGSCHHSGSRAPRAARSQNQWFCVVEFISRKALFCNSQSSGRKKGGPGGKVDFLPHMLFVFLAEHNWHMRRPAPSQAQGFWAKIREKALSLRRRKVFIFGPRFLFARANRNRRPKSRGPFFGNSLLRGEYPPCWHRIKK